ncbi:NPCBM-associated, NEW3 domain of alpha-galactosidase [uncultured archaeon]|nr:NPCBM-associated, NEW3 domain of alpha-galactosidase [uncultured archaeon]
MKKYASILTAMLILSMFSGMAAGSLPVIAAEETALIAQVPAGEQSENFTKLEISPRYGNLRLQAGEDKELTVTIKNKEKKAISVKPIVVIAPYGEYMMEKEWITITPDSVEIPEGASQKFTIKTSIPKDASRGYYNAQVAFSDDVMPNPYPTPFPNYINAFQLSVDVWAPLKVQIMTPYISDQLEAGRDYDYEIKLKNTADQAIGINPKLGSDPSYGPFGGMTTPALPDDAITITSPKSIPAGATETVKIHVTVPGDAKGYYNGYVDLGIDDMSVRDWEGRVNINFNLWKQPTEPFTRSFTLNKEAPITIEVSSAYNYGYGYPYGKSGGAKTPEPSFETTLIGPDGKQVDLTVTKTVTKGNVNMGGDRPPWEIDSESIYQENGIQRIETYKAKGSTGEWKLKVLPRNTQGFDYSITIGE